MRRVGRPRSVLGKRRCDYQAVGMSAPVVAEFGKLLATAAPAELGPGPRAGVQSEAALNLTLEDLFRRTKLPSAPQPLIRSLLLLWHDHLDAAHTLAQGIETADGSFVHAIMHRREPDAWNSKYWWRRVGHHPAFPEIARRVAALLARSGRREDAELAARLVPGGKWDAAAFVDACAAAKDKMVIPTLREIQRLETEVLLESFCHE